MTQYVKNIAWGLAGAAALTLPAAVSAQWGKGIENARSSGTPGGTIFDIIKTTMKWMLGIFGIPRYHRFRHCWYPLPDCDGRRRAHQDGQGCHAVFHLGRDCGFDRLCDYSGGQYVAGSFLDLVLALLVDKKKTWPRCSQTAGFLRFSQYRATPPHHCALFM